MTRRRILFLIESLAGGGAEKVLSTLIQYINKDIFNVTVCAISGGGEYESVIANNVGYTFLLKKPTGNNPFGKVIYLIKHRLIYKWLPLSLVYRIFVPQNNDVEIAFIEGFATKLLSHSTNRNARKIAWIHTDLKNNHWTKSVFRSMEEEFKSYQRFIEVVGVSNTVKDAFLKEFIKVTVPVQTLYNPINSQEIISMANEELVSRPQGLLLVTVGRLESQKGYDRLIYVVKRLIDEGYKFVLWILGIGSQKEMLQEYIRENHIEDSVKLLGFHSNPYKYMVKADLFICSSRSEGYSTAVTEAFILGLPVITTNCSGMEELLNNGEYGIITKNDDEALYSGLKKLLDNSDLLEHYRLKAVERGKDFSIESLMTPIEQLFLK